MTKPPFMIALEKNDPDLASRLEAVRAWIETEGALPVKTKVLIGLFGDTILNHPEGVKAIAARARALGASEDEIKETVRMAFLFGGLPALVTGTNAYKKPE